MTPPPPLLFIRELRKSFGATLVLNVAQFEIARGGCAILQGANGAGKTTFLKIIAGLLRPDSHGHFEFDGVIRRRWRADSRMTYLHQSPYLFSATVRANIEYGLRRGKFTKVAERANAAMKWAGVAHLAGRSAMSLSGGEVRRVALARVRAISPLLYLLDEPTAHLDGEGAEKVASLIADLRKGGASVLLSTHDPSFLDVPDGVFWLLKNGDTLRKN